MTEFLNDKTEEISFKEILLAFQDWKSYFFSKWLIILIFCAAGGTIGLAYSFFNKPSYVAELTFVLEDDKSSGGFSGLGGLASQFGVDLGSSGGGAFEGENLLGLMYSKSMIKKTLLSPVIVKGRKITFADFYRDISDMDESQQSKRVRFSEVIKGDTVDRNKTLDGIYGKLVKENIFVGKRDKKTNIITVSVSSANENFSKLFAERLVKEVSDLYVNTKTKKAVNNIQILQHQADSIRAALNSALSGVATSTDNTPNPNPARQAIKVSSQRRQFDVQVNQAVLSQLIPNLEMSKIALRKETPLIQVIDRPSLPLPVVAFGRKRGIMFGVTIGLFIAIAYLTIIKVSTRILK